MRILVLVLLFLAACNIFETGPVKKVDPTPTISPTQPEPTPTSVPTIVEVKPTSPVVAPTPLPTPVAKVNPCELAPYTMKLGNSKWQKDVVLPVSGKWVLESSLATKEDVFPDNRLFPKDSFELIQAHLDRSCVEMKKMGFKSCDIHQNYYVKQWTPPEGGKAGQAATGNLRPSVVEELMTCNMMWRSGAKPKPGTKFLITRGSFSVVICMGYEVGPGSEDWLGGCQGEVFSALGGTSDRVMKIGYLKDQTLPYGPVKCE